MRVEPLTVHVDGLVTEEIRRVHGLGPFFFIVLVRQDLSSRMLTACARYITDLGHVGECVLSLAHIVDEIGGSLGILRVLRDYPTVEPYVRALLRHNVVEHHTHLSGFFDGELCVTGPAEVEPCFAFCHLLFTEVHFPTADLFLGLEQDLLDRRYAFGRDVTNHFVAIEFTLLDLVVERIEHEYRIDVTERIFHQDSVLELRIEDSSPAHEVLAVDELRVVDESGCSPHVTGGVVAYPNVGIRRHLLELIRHERRDIIEVIDAVRDEVLLDRQNQIFLEHALNDILRRTEHIVVFVSHFDLGQRGLVDIEGLIDELHLLAGLVKIPLFKTGLDTFVDVVSPVEHFQLMRTVRAAARSENDGSNCQYAYKDFFLSHKGTINFVFHFSSCLLLRMLIMIKATSITSRMMVKSGRSSGVRPPLRASE